MGAGVREEGWQRTVQEPQPSPAQPSVGAPRGGGKAASCRRLLLLARDRQSQAGQLGQTWRFVSPTSRLPLTLTSQAPPPLRKAEKPEGSWGQARRRSPPLRPNPLLSLKGPLKETNNPRRVRIPTAQAWMDRGRVSPGSNLLPAGTHHTGRVCRYHRIHT